MDGGGVGGGESEGEVGGITLSVRAGAVVRGREEVGGKRRIRIRIRIRVRVVGVDIGVGGEGV